IPYRKFMLQIAEHYDLGNEPLFAARYYFKSAQSTYCNGALKETLKLCQRALEKIRPLPRDITEHDKLHAEIIILKLTASEVWWRGKPGHGEPSEEETLTEEAEAAASRIGNLSLLARIKYLKGKIYIISYDIDSAVKVLKEALQTAQDAQDSL